MSNFNIAIFEFNYKFVKFSFWFWSNIEKRLRGNAKMPTLERLEKGMSNGNIAAKYGVLYKLYKLGSRAKKKRDSLEK